VRIEREGPEMTKEQIFLVIVLLSLCCRVQGQKRQVANAGDISCKGSPLLAELTRAPGSTVLSSYGYDLNEQWECSKIESPWITGATMLQFRKVNPRMGSPIDLVASFSVLKVNGIAQIWVIPISSGSQVIEIPNLAPEVDTDPHNIAAFNALLSSCLRPPRDASGWNSIGNLYMTLVGDAGVVPIEDPPGQSKACNLGVECALSFKYPGTDANQTERLYSTWTLTFNPGDGSRPTKLTKVGWLRSFRYAGDPPPPPR
jgi:hypothetical protein